MALTDFTIAGVPADAQSGRFTLEGMGNRGKPDVPGYSTDQMQEVMDELVTKVMAPAFNAMLAEAASNFAALATYDGREVVDDVTGAQGTDIPSIEAIGSLGGGDMTKAEYASLTTGVVAHAALADNASDSERLGGNPSGYYATSSGLNSVSSVATSANSTAVTAASQVSSLQSTVNQLQTRVSIIENILRQHGWM